MKKFDYVKLTRDQEDSLKDIIDDFELEDQSVRERQIRSWKRMELLWYGFTNFYWDYVAHDWRIYGYNSYDSGVDDNQGAYYDKNINVFRAFGETIIAALSATVPPIKCLPDDVDNVNDLLTAKSGSKIAELVYNHVDAPLLWVRALFTYYIQGLVAAYNYTVEDKKYGEVDIREEHDELVDGTQSVCPSCGTVMMEGEKQVSEEIASQEKDEFDPDDDDIVLHDLLNKDKLLCPNCQIEVDPELKDSKVVITRITGVTRQPKARQKVEINGGLYVKVPNWARSQEDCPYISYNYETHFSTLFEEYPELRDKFQDLNGKLTNADGNQLYERWGRLNPQYRGEYPLNTPTCRNWWLRPSAFNSLEDEDMIKTLKKKFPDGAHVVLINDQFIGACNQAMDDHWTLMINPLSNSITYDPLGQLEVAVQEITTNLVSLELQCIEHSVPLTFFNPKFVNSEQLRQTEVTPGAMVPTKTVGENRNISDGFHTLQTATVSPELAPFGSKINEMGQFVLGATPQIWGGTSNSSSRTASQYAMQRNGAQVRLSALTGRTVNLFWKNIFAKVIPAYMKNMLEDERLVTPKGKDSFEQVVIKKSQLEGKIGDYRLEAPEGLPQSLDQIRETLTQMIQTNNPDILAAIGSPENLPFMAKIYGLTGFVVPGEADREKQYEEIGLLLNSGPIPTPPNPMQPQGGEQSSIQPELTVDNHMVEAEICRNWLVGEKGRQCKTDNPDGYRNILLHLQAHMQMMQQLQGGMQPPQQQGNQQQQQPNGGESQAEPPKDNVRQLRPVAKG